MVILGAWVIGMALEVLGFAEGFWVDWCVDIGVDADDAETVGDWSGSELVGRYPARSELKVVRGVIVLGMRCEGLDSEYTVTSSSSYSSSLEVKVRSLEMRRVPGIDFSSCTAPTFSHIQGISNRGYELSFQNVPEWRKCTRTIPSTSMKARVIKVQSSEVCRMCGMDWNRNRGYLRSSQVEQDEWVEFDIQNAET